MRRMSLKRADHLRESGRYDASSTFPRAPQKRRKPSRGVSRRVRAAVLARDGYRCVRCGVYIGIGPEGRYPYSIHHRKQRSLGGDDSLPNLITLCGTGATGCHGEVHDDPAADRLAGYMLSSWQEPRTVGVLYDAPPREGQDVSAYWYLHCDGSLQEGPEQ